jgi:hypothetical protein
LGQVDFISANAPDPPTASSLNYALSLFVDYTTNQIWLPDVYNHRVLRFNGLPVNVTAPAVPQNPSATQGDAQVTLKWSKNTDINFYRYRIYGGTSSNPTTIIDSTTNGIADTMRVIHGLTNSTKYYFRITAVNLSLLESGFSTEVFATPVTGIGVEGNGNSIPKDYSLAQNFPNPFNPSTTIKFGLPEKSQVSLKIFDVLGREVTTLVNQELSAGYYSYQWNGVKLSSGIYIYRLTASYMKDNTQHDFTQVKKLLLQK